MLLISLGGCNGGNKSARAQTHVSDACAGDCSRSVVITYDIVRLDTAGRYLLTTQYEMPQLLNLPYPVYYYKNKYAANVFRKKEVIFHKVNICVSL